ncbi:cytochrome c3 family protein [Neobacillus sp. GCM10023253]|uniref:cytochrome c3 family protein n=1 Tax=Neobacillus sp. GCM10023253 TaxID=3252644 RepID=UPI003614D46F
MRKFSLSLLFALMLFGMFAAAASAEEHYNGGLTPGTADGILPNANETGNGVDVNDGSAKGTVVKALTGQNVHTSYQNNTNSCASCHQVHTAQGDQLLFADTVYNTCTACHDGTLGFANVFTDGSIAADPSKAMGGAGTFGGTHGASQHMSNDSLQISAAPGGNPVSTSKVKGTQWGESFSCASCHAPHGSYSDRLLQYNPNGIASMPASQGGNQLENVPVVDTLTGQTAAVVLLRSTDADGNVTVAQYNKGTSGYTKSEAPWLYGYDSRTDGKTYWSRLMENDTTVAAYGSTSGVYFDYEHAQAYSTSTAGATALGKATKGFIARPVVVKMAKNGHNVVQSAYFAGAPLAQFENVTEQEMKDLGYTVGTDTNKTVKNVGVKMSQFCAACHSDYLQANSDGKKSHFGDEYAAYRHSTNSDSYTCVRCHYGHGTDAYIMKDALGRTIKDLVADGGKFAGDETSALAYMQDNNASSALKKFTNMSVCWACHNSSHAETIKNTEREADHPIGMPNGY